MVAAMIGQQAVPMQGYYTYKQCLSLLYALVCTQKYHRHTNLYAVHDEGVWAQAVHMLTDDLHMDRTKVAPSSVKHDSNNLQKNC